MIRNVYYENDFLADITLPSMLWTIAYCDGLFSPATELKIGMDNSEAQF